MHSAAPDEMKHIPTSRWEAWCDTFSNGNRGRLIRIELDEELGGEPLVAGAKLVAIDYDPPGKGNAFTISFGPDEAPTRHTINNPVALRQDQDVNGLVVSIRVEDAEGGVTMVRFD